MLDLTGSMGSWLAEAKKKFTAITDELATQIAKTGQAVSTNIVNCKTKRLPKRSAMGPETMPKMTVPVFWIMTQKIKSRSEKI